MYPEYEGTLTFRSPKIPKPVKAAASSFYAQCLRSRKAGLPPPNYTIRQFVTWWLEKSKTFKGERAACGRIDHSLGYSFDNIEMQTPSDNSKESFARNRIHAMSPHKSKKVLISCKKTGLLIAESSSRHDTARLFDVSLHLVQMIINGERSQSKKIPFNLSCGEA